jgi:hypothetical protein
MAKKSKKAKLKKHVCSWPVENCGQCEKRWSKFKSEYELFLGFAYGLELQRSSEDTIGHINVLHLKNIQEILNKTIRYFYQWENWEKNRG